MSLKERIDVFRELVEETYRICPTGTGGSFGEILCYELHSQPVNPRMGIGTGLTFKELAEKWGIDLSFLGDLIADHCKRL
jgi:hypothetical protein